MHLNLGREISIYLNLGPRNKSILVAFRPQMRLNVLAVYVIILIVVMRSWDEFVLVARSWDEFVLVAGVQRVPQCSGWRERMRAPVSSAYEVRPRYVYIRTQSGRQIFLRKSVCWRVSGWVGDYKPPSEGRNPGKWGAHNGILARDLIINDGRALSSWEQ